MIAPAIIGRLMMSKLGQSYLGNEVIKRGGPLADALIKRLGPNGGILGYEANQSLNSR